MTEACVEIPIPSLTAGPGGVRGLLAPPMERPSATDDIDLLRRDLDALMSEMPALRQSVYDLQRPGLSTLAQPSRLRGLPGASPGRGSSIQAARANHKHIGTQGGVAYVSRAFWFIAGTLVTGDIQGGRRRASGDATVEGSVVTLITAWAYVETAPVGAAIIFDIDYIDPDTGASASIFITRPQIAAGANTVTSTGFVLPNSRPINSVFTLSLDQIGSTTAGNNLSVQLDIVVMTRNFTILSS